jgi:CTP synthase
MNTHKKIISKKSVEKKPKHDPRYLFVVGGVISGVGKGIAASSIARILIDRGLTVTAIKIDPYINVDAGTMNPTEHGEVFVLNDGDETDQDMGNYERFLNTDLTRMNYMTTGRVYQSVIEAERNLEYKGKCVEVVPHVPMEVIRRIETAGKNANADVVIVEIGGTVGEYQNILFLEAARMMKTKRPDRVFFSVVSYLPIPGKIGEMKTKPTQMAVRTLNASGILPDIIIARASTTLDQKRKEKIAFMCMIDPKRVISAPDVASIYDVPINFEKEGLGDILSGLMQLATKKPKTSDWKSFINRVHRTKKQVTIAVVGKYFETGDYVLSDSYVSVIEAIKYSAYYAGTEPTLVWLNAVDFEKDPKRINELKKYDGVLVPGGFGARGVEGLINVIHYVRKNNIPYFGICYGMQLAVIEYARHVAGMSGAHTIEVDPKTPFPVIDIMEHQKELLQQNHYGNSMRLGQYPAIVEKNTLAYQAYKRESITERHRHRYEVNNQYVEKLKKSGLRFSATSPDGNLMEIIELPKSVHPYFIAVQFHPEFLARPLDPHPVFTAFVSACGK